MANIFTSIPVPTANGSGAAVDVSSFGASKTISVAGILPGAVIVEISNQLVPTSWAPVASFSNPDGIVVNAAARWMRATVTGFVPGFVTPTATCDVGGTDDGATFANLPVTAGNGSGAAVDISSLGLFKTIVVGGTFGGNVQVELSEDGASNWSQIGFGFPQPGQQSQIVAAHFMRVTRGGVPTIAPGMPTVDVGGCAPVGGGGGGGGNVTPVIYTAVGGEQTFNVPIGKTLTTTAYVVTGSTAGTAFQITMDMPTSGRTTTQFQVVTSAPLTAGDILNFLLAD